MFYHRFGARKGCVRPECRFIHSINDHVNMLLDSPDDAACAKKITALLAMVESVPTVAKEIAAQGPPTHADVDTAVLYGPREPPSDPALESNLQKFCDAVTRMHIDMEATAVVVEAVAATQESTCPGLRGSLLEELQRLFSDPAGDALVLATSEEHLSLPQSVPDSVSTRSVVFPHRALEAFEKRRLMEEEVGGR